MSKKYPDIKRNSSESSHDHAGRFFSPVGIKTEVVGAVMVVACVFKGRGFNQSINQSINQPINRSIDRSIDRYFIERALSHNELSHLRRERKLEIIVY